MPHLEDSGVLLRQGAQIGFALPAFAQWFASRALVAGEVSIEQLVTEPEDLDLWTYPLALAIATGSSETAYEILEPLLNTFAGFAFVVLDLSIGQNASDGGTAPNWRTSGSAIQRAIATLARSLGPAASVLLDVGPDGAPLPLSASTTEQQLTVAVWDHGTSQPPLDRFSAGPPKTPGVVPRSQRSGPVAAGGPWALKWVLDDLRFRSAELLESRSLTVAPDDVLGREEIWVSATELLNVSPTVASQVKISQVEDRLDQLTRGGRLALFAKGPGSPAHDARVLYAAVRQAADSGATHLHRPLPGPDVHGPIPMFSQDRTIERVRRIYELAAVGYRELVASWFPTLASRFEHFVLLPARIHVDVGPGPTVSEDVEPLPAGSADSVLVECRASRREHEFDEFRLRYQQQQRARPAAARWLPGTFKSRVFDLTANYAVRTVVYSWLESDLSQLGVLKTPHLGRDSVATVVRRSNTD